MIFRKIKRFFVEQVVLVGEAITDIAIHDAAPEVVSHAAKYCIVDTSDKSRIRVERGCVRAYLPIAEDGTLMSRHIWWEHDAIDYHKPNYEDIIAFLNGLTMEEAAEIAENHGLDSTSVLSTPVYYPYRERYYMNGKKDVHEKL